MSKSASSAFAAWRTRAARRLTPRLMLPDLTIDRVARRGLDLRLVVGGKAGGADDVDDARLRGELGEGDGRGRRR